MFQKKQGREKPKTQPKQTTSKNNTTVLLNTCCPKNRITTTNPHPTGKQQGLAKSKQP
ncbi:hypothetical protein [Corynebacterium sp.]|uniref:hypothetical protein n=1 Tax=Corynebacterium sp. TaxID=1720 RepID=UPI0037368E87